jgi:hypothetical protein
MKAKGRSFIGSALLSVSILVLPAHGDEGAAATARKSMQQVGSALSNPKFAAAIGKSKKAKPARVTVPECLRAAGEDPKSSHALIQLDLEVVACDLFTFQPGPPPAAPAPSVPVSPVHDLSNPDGNTLMFVEKTIGDIRKAVKDLMILGKAGQQTRAALEKTAAALEVYVNR